jgi:hypothetical protein
MPADAVILLVYFDFLIWFGFISRFLVALILVYFAIPHCTDFGLFRLLMTSILVGFLLL